MTDINRNTIRKTYDGLLKTGSEGNPGDDILLTIRFADADVIHNAKNAEQIVERAKSKEFRFSPPGDPAKFVVDSFLSIKSAVFLSGSSVAIRSIPNFDETLAEIDAEIEVEAKQERLDEIDLIVDDILANPDNFTAHKPRLQLLRV